MTSENSRVVPDGAEPQSPTSRASTELAVLALVRIGTRRCRLAAVLMAVIVGFAAQIGDQAVAQAKQSVLYLDAPDVSAERASRAGVVADSYATPGSPASSETLAWLEVPVRPIRVSSPPGGVEGAFASIIAPDGEEGGVTPSAALLAGQVMIAQLEASPSEGEGGDTELASAGAVRPELGDGTRTPEAESEADGPDGTGEQPGDAGSTPAAGTPTYASTSGTDAPVAEPSGAPGVVVPAPSPVGEEAPDEAPQQTPPTELASAPPDTDATPFLESGTDDEAYGPTGPISDATGQVPTSPVMESPENNRVEEQTYPEGGAPAAEPDTAEGKLAGAELAAEEPKSESTPVDIGPTSGEGAGIALAPVSPLAAEEEPTATEGDSELVGSQSPAWPPADTGGSEVAYAEPPLSDGTPEVPSGTHAPETVPETPADDTGEERVEIVVVSEEAQVSEMPAEAPAEPPSEEQAPAEDVPPSEVPPVREEVGENAPPDQGPPQDDGTGEEQTPSEVPPVEQPSVSKETRVERPSGGTSPEGAQSPADGEPPTDGPGTQDDASQAPPEGRRPGGERPEGSKDAAVPPRGMEAPERPNVPSEKPVASPEDQAPENSLKGRRNDRQGTNSEEGTGPTNDRGWPDVLPTDLVGQIEENGVAGEVVRREVCDLAGTLGGDRTAREEQAFSGTDPSSGGAGISDTPPEPPVQTTPRLPGEQMVAEPIPQAGHVLPQATTEEHTTRQAAVEQSGRQRVAARRFAREQAARQRRFAAERAEQVGMEQYEEPFYGEAQQAPATKSAVAPVPESVAVDETTATGTEGSPRGGSEQPRELPGDVRKSRNTLVKPKIHSRGGE